MLLPSPTLRKVLLDTCIVRPWKCPHIWRTEVLLPVFERYSPMNLLVRYRTVRAVNTQNLDEHLFTCWIKEVNIEDKASQLPWVIPLLLTGVISLYSLQRFIWEGTRIEGRLRSSIETTHICFSWKITPVTHVDRICIGLLAVWYHGVISLVHCRLIPSQ